MKKIVVTLLILAGIAAVWLNRKPQAAPVLKTVQTDAPVNTPEQILMNDYEKIAKNLDPVNTAGEEWKEINNYALSPATLVKAENAKTFFNTAQKNLPDIYSCLKKDFCGMETRNEDDAYFDDQRTPAHILINRNLKIMKEALLKDQSLASQVDWELMQDLAASESEMLSVESIDIIRQFDSKNVKTDDLIKLTENAKGTAKAEALEKIAKNNDANGKVILASEIADTFAVADNDTVISILEKLGGMGFSKDQTAKMLKNLCDRKEDHNWKMIRYEALKINKDFERNCN